MSLREPRAAGLLLPRALAPATTRPRLLVIPPDTEGASSRGRSPVRPPSTSRRTSELDLHTPAGGLWSPAQTQRPPRVGRKLPQASQDRRQAVTQAPLQGARIEVHGARGRPPGPQGQQDEAGAGTARWPAVGGQEAGREAGVTPHGRGKSAQWRPRADEWVPAPGPSSHREGRTRSQHAQLLAPAPPRHDGEPGSEPRGPPGSTFRRSLESEHNLGRTGKSGNQGSLTTTDSKVRVCGGTRIPKRVSTRDLTLGSEWPGDAAAGALGARGRSRPPGGALGPSANRAGCHARKHGAVAPRGREKRTSARRGRVFAEPCGVEGHVLPAPRELSRKEPLRSRDGPDRLSAAQVEPRAPSQG